MKSMSMISLLVCVAGLVPSRICAQDTAGVEAPLADQLHDLVVLVHGMGRTRGSMRPLERALEASGYEVLNFGYHSRRQRVAESGEALATRLESQIARADIRKIHFVGHSLGNIVIRWVLAHEAVDAWPEKVGRVVMLAPPNQGSHRADLFAGHFSWLVRPLTDLTTREDSTARTIPTPEKIEIGVIAGSRDHVVWVQETCLEGMTDHVVVSSGHTFIMRRSVVLDLTRRFLRDGSFSPENKSDQCRAFSVRAGRFDHR